MADDKEQKKEEQKKVVASCSINVDDIFVQLHLKAAKETKECKIQNSAIEGEGKSAKFNGAGSHVIMALPLKGETIDIQTALAGLKKYVSFFNGPDVAGKLTEGDLIPKNVDKDDKAPTKESAVCVPSFKDFLTEEGTYKDDLDAKSKNAAKEKKYDLAKSKADKANKEVGDTVANSFYITYKIAIEGQKESPLKDAFKSFSSGLIRGLGVQGFSWKTGAKGKEHTIGDVIDTLSKAFGKIDAGELKTRFTKNVQAKYPQTLAKDVEYYDQKTLLKYIGGQLDTKQKQKLKRADYALCYKVNKNDKSKKLITADFVADCITRSIKGLFKKIKSSVSKNDVIIVNDYAETNKDQKKDVGKLEVKKDTNKVELSKDNASEVKKESVQIEIKELLNGKKRSIVKEHLMTAFDVGMSIFESDSMLMNLLEANSKQTVIQQIAKSLESVQDEEKWKNAVDQYKGDLTGSTPEHKVMVKPKDSAPYPLTNDKVKERISNLSNLKTTQPLVITSLPTLKRLMEVIDELKKDNDFTKTEDATQHEDSDLIEEIISNSKQMLEKCETLVKISPKQTSEIIKKFNSASEYTALTALAKEHKDIYNAIKTNDNSQLEQLLLKMNDRKYFIKLSDAISSCNSVLDKMIAEYSAEGKVSASKSNSDYVLYIVPMKGLKLGKDTSDADDKKEVEGKGK